MLRLIIGVLLLLPSLAWAEIGKIESFSGSVRVLTFDGQARSARIGLPISLGDIVETRADSKAAIRLNDRSVFSISADSTFEMDAFVFDEAGESRHEMKASVLKGAFKFVSGRVGSGKKQRFITLSNATVGIRGTQLIGINDDVSQVVLLTGAIDVFTDLGRQILTRPNQAVSIDATGAVSEPTILQPAVLRRIGDAVGLSVEPVDEAAPESTGPTSEQAPVEEEAEKQAEEEEAAQDSEATEEEKPEEESGTAEQTTQTKQDEQPAEETGTGSQTAEAEPAAAEPAEPQATSTQPAIADNDEKQNAQNNVANDTAAPQPVEPQDKPENIDSPAPQIADANQPAAQPEEDKDGSAAALLAAAPAVAAAAEPALTASPPSPPAAASPVEPLSVPQTENAGAGQSAANAALAGDNNDLVSSFDVEIDAQIARETTQNDTSATGGAATAAGGAASATGGVAGAVGAAVTGIVDFISDAADAFVDLVSATPEESAAETRSGVTENVTSDRDGDGVPNEQDAFPDDGKETADMDGDGKGDNSDTDRDGDGVANSEDAFPDDKDETADTDGDGLGDNEEVVLGTDPKLADTDGDGLSDPVEIAMLFDPTAKDSDGDGINDGDDHPFDIGGYSLAETKNQIDDRFVTSAAKALDLYGDEDRFSTAEALSSRLGTDIVELSAPEQTFTDGIYYYDNRGDWTATIKPLVRIDFGSNQAGLSARLSGDFGTWGKFSDQLFTDQESMSSGKVGRFGFFANRDVKVSGYSSGQEEKEVSLFLDLDIFKNIGTASDVEADALAVGETRVKLYKSINVSPGTANFGTDYIGVESDRFILTPGTGD